MQYSNSGILSTIGNTPLVRLERFLDTPRFNLFGKLEFLNPGGSIKDRPAFLMIHEALKSGTVNQETTIVESSSGNLGIGLAQVCAYFRLKLICIVDVKTTFTNRNLLEAYGARLEIVDEPDPESNELLQARIKRVQHLLKTIPNSFNCNQYANLNNPYAHYHTMHEIATALDNHVDYLFCAPSTCGTLRGCSEYIKQWKLNTKIVAVDAEGSVIFGGHPKKRLIPGHGAGRVPELYRPNLESSRVTVSDLDCVLGCRRLLKREAIMAGGSSGAVMSAILKMQSAIPAGANCVAILADRGERYMDSIYSDCWIHEHFGNIQLNFNVMEATNGSR